MNDTSIEIEAKFPGGEAEFGAITDWLRTVGGFEVAPTNPGHRLHLYFDEDSRLLNAGCRLRCIVAPGEWIRYDFKIDDPSGGRETVELSWKVAEPRPLNEAVDYFLDQLGSETAGRILSLARPSLGIALAMTGMHVKAIASREDGTELEVSWDVLADLVVGRHLSEIEVELACGNPVEFENLIARLQSETGLHQDGRSKLEKMLGTG